MSHSCTHKGIKTEVHKLDLDPNTHVSVELVILCFADFKLNVANKV